MTISSLSLMINRPGRALELPYSVSGLQVDYDMDRLRSSLAAAAAVSTLPDYTLNGNDLTQAGALRPTFSPNGSKFNGHAFISFLKASTQYMFAAAPPIATVLGGSDVPFSVFAVVCRDTKISADELLWSLANSGSTSLNYFSGGYRYQNSNSQRIYQDVRDAAGTAATISTGQNEASDLAAQVICWRFTGTICQIYVAGATYNPLQDALVNTNGTSSDYTAQGAFSPNQMSLGSRRRGASVDKSCDIHLARFLMYSRAVTDAELYKLMTYLWARYCDKKAQSPLALGFSSWWDADQMVGDHGDSVDGLYDQISGQGFSATGFSQPTLYVEGSRRFVRFEAGSGEGAQQDGAYNEHLHAGADFTLAMAFRFPSGGSGERPILDTNGNSTTAKGVCVLLDDDDLLVRIGNGTTAVLASTGFVRPDEWNTLVVVHQETVPSSEENYAVWINGERYWPIDPTNDEVSGTAVGNLTLGQVTGGGTTTGVDIGEIAVSQNALGSYSEVVALCDYLADKWDAWGWSVAAGNGVGNLLNDPTYPHKGFPGLLYDDGWLVTYRAGPDHGSSAGVAAAVTSADRRRWSDERTIYDDSANYDWRGTNFLAKIDGVYVLGGNLSATDSTLLPYTAHILRSTNRGRTWSSPIVLSHDTDAYLVGAFNETLDYDEGVNSVVKVSDGRWIAHFMVTIDGSAGFHIVQCESSDRGKTWSEPTPIYFGRATGAGGDFPQDERIQEPVCIVFPDGEVVLAMRADVTATDTTGRIYFARSTDDCDTWLPATFTTEYILGYGNPRMEMDENERLYLIHRGQVGEAYAYLRTSDDRGRTWTDPVRLSNLNPEHAAVATNVSGYGNMAYGYMTKDGDGNIVAALALEQSDDADIRVGLIHKRRPVRAVQLEQTSGQYLGVASSSVWDVSEAEGFTAAGWIYRDSTGTTYLAGKYGNAGNRSWLISLTASGYVQVRLCADGTTPTTFTSTVAASSAGQWYFVAVRYDAATGAFTVTVDDTEDSTTHAGGIFASGASVTLGYSGISPSESFDGRMNLWGFWSRSLSDAQLTQLRQGLEYRDLSNALRAGLIAYYELGQYSYTRTDSSGNGQHLTPVNAPGNADGVNAI